MNQNERLDYLAEQFAKDYDETVRRTASPYERASMQYRKLEIPADAAGKWRLLRSLMNVRMPGKLPSSVLEVQDAYLKERILENGIVQIADLPTAADQGSSHPHAEHISVWQGDITRLAADAIVNAANSQMLGCFVPMHSCIDNCIHTFAGVQLRAECSRKMNELRAKFGPEYEQPTAVPMLTDGYNLPAKKVVHIVGPIVSGRLTKALEEDLADCYRSTLDLCLENEIKSVAFCCISTGVFHFPNRRAAEIAVQTVTDWMDQHPGQMERIIFNVFKEEDKIYYEAEIQ